MKDKLITTFNANKKDFEHFYRLYKRDGGNDFLCSAMDYYGRCHMIHLILASDFNCYECTGAFMEMKEMEKNLY